MVEGRQHNSGELEGHVEYVEAVEAPLEELIFDEMWRTEYIGIRVTTPGLGIKFVSDSDPNEVYSAIRTDRKNFPSSMYYLYKQTVEGEEREGVLIGSFRVDVNGNS
jgi:hypothetical protein